MAERIAKNCRTCRHLEWVDGDGWPDNSGWTCNGREPNEKHERQLQNSKYLLRYKRCHERPAPAPKGEQHG